MEFLRATKRRSLLSEGLYVILNAALAFGMLGLVMAIDSPLPAIALMLLSKWRVLAVRPRFWPANVQANLVDIIAGLSAAVLLYGASGRFGLQLFVALAYLAWLLFLKPRTKRKWMTVQAGTATFFGVWALMLVSSDWPVSIVVLVGWLIGYASTRHVLGAYEKNHVLFDSLVWGFVMAQVIWLTYHWTLGYQLPGLPGVMVPQGAIIVLALSFAAERIYRSIDKNGKLHSGDVILPVLLSASVILLALTVFNTLPSTS